MNALKARLLTFSRWPLQSPEPAALAEAGFYYTGNAEEGEDSVTCFCCGKELSGWEAGDDPLSEHLAHPKSRAGCSWAVLMHERRNPSIPPDHATLLKAREASFKGWPHEKERGWVGKSKKMAKAGFHFTPSSESPDAVECMYCHLELDGWEPKDDPLVEHRRRSQGLKCAFFSGLITNGAASSIFALTKNAFSAEKTQVWDEQTESIVVASKETSLAPKQRTNVAQKKPAKRKIPPARGTKATTYGEPSEESEPLQEPVPIILVSPRKKRPSADVVDLISRESSQPPSPKKRRSSRVRSNSVVSTTSYLEDIWSPEEQPKRSRLKTRGKATRTPLDELTERVHNSSSADTGIISSSIKEEIEEPDHVIDQLHVGMKPRTGLQTEEKENKIRRSPNQAQGFVPKVRQPVRRGSSSTSISSEPAASHTNSISVIGTQQLSEHIEEKEEFDLSQQDVIKIPGIPLEENKIQSNDAYPDSSILYPSSVLSGPIGMSSGTAIGSHTAVQKDNNQASFQHARPDPCQLTPFDAPLSSEIMEERTIEQSLCTNQMASLQSGESVCNPAVSIVGGDDDDDEGLQAKIPPQLVNTKSGCSNSIEQVKTQELFVNVKETLLLNSTVLPMTNRNSLTSECIMEVDEPEQDESRPCMPIDGALPSVSQVKAGSAAVDRSQNVSITRDGGEKAYNASPSALLTNGHFLHVDATQSSSSSQPLSSGPTNADLVQPCIVEDGKIAPGSDCYETYLELMSFARQSGACSSQLPLSLTEADQCMTFEKWIRHSTEIAVSQLEAHCENMISKLEEAGELARVAILSV